MALTGPAEPRSVFLALPFNLRDSVRGYRQTLMVLEDRFNITIKHGDHTTNAIGILERTTKLMSDCRVRLFDLTGFSPNVIFEFGIARGAQLPHVYALRRQPRFGDKPIPSMLSNIDIPIYANAKTIEGILTRALEAHYWPTDIAFTEGDLDWLSTQIRELTYPRCETDKFELSDALGIADGFITQAIKQFFVANGDAIAIGVGPAPRYRFDYESMRPVPSAGAQALR